MPNTLKARPETENLQEKLQVFTARRYSVIGPLNQVRVHMKKAAETANITKMASATAELDAVIADIQQELAEAVELQTAFKDFSQK